MREKTENMSQSQKSSLRIQKEKKKEIFVADLKTKF